MASKYTQQKKRKKLPEMTLKARNHPKKIQKNAIHKKVRKFQLPKLPRIRLKPLRSKNTVLVILIIGIFFWGSSLALWLEFEKKVMKPQQANLKTQQISGKDAFDARYGSEADRINEIEFAASADESLQIFVLRDYTELKKKCFVNDGYIYVPRYRVEKVVKGQFALVNRDCGGSQNAILVRGENGWSEIHTGNAPIDCGLANQFSIPRIIVSICVTENIVYQNANM